VGASVISLSVATLLVVAGLAIVGIAAGLSEDWL
jgi:hypothetical protein